MRQPASAERAHTSDDVIAFKGSADPTANDGSGAGCDKGKGKDPNTKTCRNTTYFQQDAKLWASWGVDLLKFDGCGGPFSDIEQMRDALEATGA